MARAPQQEAKSGMKGGGSGGGSRRDHDDRDQDRDDDRRSRRGDEEDAPSTSTKSAKGRRDRDEDEAEAYEAPAKSNGSGSGRGRRDDDEDDRPSKASASASSGSKKSRSNDDDDDRKASASDDDDAPINLQEADENMAREVAPRGKYLCMVDDAEFVTFKTGSKGVRLRLEVIEGDYSKGSKGPNGKRKKGLTFITNMVCVAEAAGILKASLKALGVDKKIYNNPGFRPSDLQKLCDEGDLVGVEVVADVKVGQYDGNKNNQVGRLMAPGSEDKAEGRGSFLDD